MREAAVRRGRKAKFSDDEVRERMIHYAIDNVLSHGVAYGLDSVRLDRLVVVAKVPRNAAYAVFSNDSEGRTPQENLRREVVISLLRDTPGGNATATRDVAAAKIDDVAQVLASGTSKQLREARSAVIRVVAEFNHELLHSQRWTVYRSLVTGALTSPNPDPTIVEAVEAGEQKLIASYVTLFEEFAELFRMRLKEHVTHEQFAIAVYALNDGLSNHVGRPFSNQRIQVSGTDESTSIFTVGVEALFDRFYEFAEPEF